MCSSKPFYILKVPFGPKLPFEIFFYFHGSLTQYLQQIYHSSGTEAQGCIDYSLLGFIQYTLTNFYLELIVLAYSMEGTYVELIDLLLVFKQV